MVGHGASCGTIADTNADKLEPNWFAAAASQLYPHTLKPNASIEHQMRHPARETGLQQTPKGLKCGSTHVLVDYCSNTPS